MDRKFLVESFGWGFALWLFGYVLGFVFFFLVPPAMLGWAIMPFGTALALFVLFKKTSGDMRHYAGIAVVWALLAIVLDYLFLVKLLNPADGYYKLDVYVYYALTFVLPLAVGYWKSGKKQGTT